MLAAALNETIGREVTPEAEVEVVIFERVLHSADDETDWDRTLATPPPGDEEEEFLSEEAEFAVEIIYDVTGDEAKQRCQQQNASLASVHSAEENKLFLDMVQQGLAAQSKTALTVYFPEWTGPTLLLGAHRSPGNNTAFLWDDGSVMAYTNWEQGQPDQDAGKDEGCLERSAAACQKWAFGAVIPSVASPAAHNGR
ncbi:unnamed protein product, partial [Mesorhabditis spiculigera]